VDAARLARRSGRGLAWLGGIATLLGIVLFLALAISHGWIGREARVVLAAVGSAALIAAGTWLHARRGRTEAAVAMVGTGTAGLFAALIVAGEIYALIPAAAAVAASILVGAVATALAIRWAGRAIGALGLLGALLSPFLVGAPSTTGTIALLAVAAACAAWVVLWRRWGWLGVATIVVAAPQWAHWTVDEYPGLIGGLALFLFTALGLVIAIGLQLRADDERRTRAAFAALVLNTCIAGFVGKLFLQETPGILPADLWLAVLGIAHVALGVWRPQRIRLTRPFRQLLIAIGVVLGDVAFALSASGLVLVIGWGAAAIAFAWLLRRSSGGDRERVLLGLGLSGHIGLTLTRTLIEAPPSLLGGGAEELLPVLSVAILAATCPTCARVGGTRSELLHTALDAVGLCATAYLTATVLSGPALVATWAFEAVALHRLARHARERFAQLGAYAFLGGAALLALVHAAPPAAMVTGADDLPAAALSLGAVALAGLQIARTSGGSAAIRRGLQAGSAAAILYLVSIAIITAFQPTAAATIDPVLDLSIRQQGQVLLSGLWSLVGLTGLIVGLQRNSSALRAGGLAVLLLSVAKVFLYDLSTLTSIYRVISFIVLGLLLLAGAFAYQRLRPPSPPDMRTLHPSQR
jgi:uncharacterized membrane protein